MAVQMPMLMSVKKLQPSIKRQSADSDELASHFGAPHRPLVHAREEGVGFGNDAFAEDRGGDWHAGRFGEGQQVVLQAEAVDLDVRQDHGPAGGAKKICGFVDCLTQGIRVATGQPLGRAMRRDLFGQDLVARELEVDRPLVAYGRLEHAVDLTESCLRPIEHRPCRRDFLEDLELSSQEPFTLWCKRGVTFASHDAGRSPPARSPATFRYRAPAMLLQVERPPTQ